MKKVRDVMTENPVCCEAETDLQTVAEMMCNNDCGSTPVINKDQNSKVIGMVTDRDIACRTVAKGKNPMKLSAEDCMSRDPVTVKADSNINQCLDLMEEYQIRRVPVVDNEGRCVGIICQADIARKAPSSVSGEVVREISKPSHVMAEG